MLGGDLQGVGRIGCGGAILPQDGGAAFRADDRVIGVLEDENAVGYADAERSAGAALADDRCDDRHLERHHFAQVDGDGLGDMALLSADAGKGAGRVDDCDDGQLKLAGQLHQAQRLAVALGVGAAEVAHHIFLGVAPFLGAHDHDAFVAQFGESTDHRLVVGVEPVAVQFGEIVKGKPEVVERVGAAGVAGELHPLPRGEIRVNAPAGFLDLGPDLVSFALKIHLHAAWQ